MLKEIRILHGNSRYEIFRDWQEALCRQFQSLGITSSIVPVPEAYGGTVQEHMVTLGFNLVRQWSQAAMNRYHMAWIVDHPLFMTRLYLPRLVGTTVNLDRCVVGSVDLKWMQFAKEVMGFPYAYFLPHSTIVDPFVAPDWENRPLDFVFIGSIEAPDLYTGRLREISERFAAACGPLLERLQEDFSYSCGQSLDMVIWDLTRQLKFPKDAALLFMNAFFPLLDSYHRFKDRIRLLRSIRKHTVHLYGSGPWKELNLPPNIVLHDEIPHSEVPAILRQAKVLVNHTPTLSGGAHERIFDALASGCHVLTTPSDYLAGEFSAGQGISFCGYARASEADDLLAGILGAKDSPAAVARAQEIVARRHTMAIRAGQICSILASRWPEMTRSPRPVDHCLLNVVPGVGPIETD